MNLVTFLRDQKEQQPLERLKHNLHIKLKRHQKYPNLILFKYDQLNSPLKEKIVQDCRGIILDELDDWKIVCYPYGKFFNYGECLATALDWSQPVSVTEKLDGSLMNLYFYKDEWHVSSQGKPDANGKITTHSDGKQKVRLSDEEFAKVPTYAQLFWKCFYDNAYQLPPPEYNHYCFMFELVSESNIIIVQHQKTEIKLHGIRNLITLKEEYPEEFAIKFNWPLVISYKFNSLEEVAEATKKLNPLKSEGFVCRDYHFNRVKVKSSIYVQLSLLRGKESEGLDSRRALSIIQMNEGEEFLTYFPTHREIYYQQLARYERSIEYINNLYKSIETIEDKKQFAITVNSKIEQKYRGFMFSLRKGETARDILSKLPTRDLEQYIIIL